MIFRILTKMSIDYQLYEKSMTDRIIIPEVTARQRLANSSVFKLVPNAIVAPKNHKKLQSISWKRSMSAFKKFRSRRHQQERLEDNFLEELQVVEYYKKRAYVRLAPLKGNQAALRSVGQEQDSWLRTQTSTMSYFDPNDAPLLIKESIDNSQMASQSKVKTTSKTEPTVSYVPQVQLQITESQPMEEQCSYTIVDPSSDDPFLILRKNSPRKGPKEVKNKLIKKEKVCKKTMKAIVSNSESLCQGKNGYVDHSQNLKSKNESDDPLGQTFGSYKRIETLEQIKNSANSRLNQDSLKKVKTKQTSLEMVQKVQKIESQQGDI